MDGEIVAFGGGNPSVLAGGEGYAALPVPAVIAREGERAAQRFIEFFTANIRNPNTRMAYARAVYQFMAWAEERRLPLERLNPIFISVYIEQLQQHMAPPSVQGDDPEGPAQPIARRPEGEVGHDAEDSGRHERGPSGPNRPCGRYFESGVRRSRRHDYGSTVQLKYFTTQSIRSQGSV